MNQKDQLEIVTNMQKHEIELLKSKGNDYAGKDILKNFKEVQTICQLLNIDSRTLHGTHLFYIVLKLQRLCNLLNSGKTAQNESVQDTIVDARNYLGLLACELKEDEEVNELASEEARMAFFDEYIHVKSKWLAGHPFQLEYRYEK